MSEQIGDKVKSEKAENEKPLDLWMIRSCSEYKEELYDCQSKKGRKYQKYVYGETLDCSQWKIDYDNCVKYQYKRDLKAAKELIAIEEKKRQVRLRRARYNDVWQYRSTPPEDWTAPRKGTLSGKRTEKIGGRSKTDVEETETKSRCVTS